MIALADVAKLKDASDLSFGQIARRLKTTRGTVAGLLYRRDHPHVPRPRKPSPPSIYKQGLTVRVDDEMLRRIDAFAAGTGVSRAAVLRDLLEWGLEAAGKGEE